MKETISSPESARESPSHRLLGWSSSSDVMGYAHSYHLLLSLLRSHVHLFSMTSHSVFLSTFACHHSWVFQDLLKNMHSSFDLTILKIFSSIPPWPLFSWLHFRTYLPVTISSQASPFQTLTTHLTLQSTFSRTLASTILWLHWDCHPLTLPLFPIHLSPRVLISLIPQFPWPVVVIVALDITSAWFLIFTPSAYCLGKIPILVEFSQWALYLMCGASEHWWMCTDWMWLEKK